MLRIFIRWPRDAVRLRPDWRKIVRHAWSIRLLALAAVLSGIEAALPFMQGTLDVPPGLFAALTLIATAAALVARIVAQKQFGGKD